MSPSPQAPSSSSPNFQPIFEKALEEYKKKTGKDLTTHPLAAQIKGSKSPEAILTVLERKANELNQSRSSDERLTKWLNPTVNILNALSATLGEGAGLIFPPTTIIFSGIGILLVAAKSTVANRDVLVELFDRMESFFGRLKTYTEVPPTHAVTDVLVKIMAEVLSILAIATKGMKERRTKTFLKKLAGMNDVEDALQRLRQLEQGELLTVIAQLSRDEQETKGIVKEILSKMDARNWEEVLQKLRGWLSPPDPSTNYNIGLRDLHEETATWFLEGRVFQDWHSTGSLLWIHGKPGSGKSILCSAIIQRILSLSEGGRASVAYFDFDFRDENKKHRHNLLPSLLFQFAAHSIPCCDILSLVYSAHGGKGTQQPSDDVLIKCLANVLSATTQHPIYIIVDALDECPDTSGVRSPRERVLSLIKDLVNLRLPNLHICVTSRPEADISIRLEPLTSRRVSLHDQTGHKEDIAKYIKSEVAVIANDKRWRVDDKKLVIETLSERADGMFRWVYCQLEMLRLCLRSNVRHFLNQLPDSLDETYERILKAIHKTNRGHVQRLLQCLTVAIRPLSVNELAAILPFKPEVIEGEVPTFDADSRPEDQERELLSACPSLITIVGGPNSRVVQFSHFSVKEFITSDRLATSAQDLSRYHILPDAAHITFAQASLGVLLRLDNRVDSQNVMSIPLAEYAAKYWVSHAQVGSVSSHVICAMKTLFDSDKPHFSAWIQIYDIDKPVVEGQRQGTTTPLYYSALCGFYNLVEHLIKEHPQHVNTLGGEHDYPLVAALHGGYIRVVKLLFQHGATLDVRGREDQTPLHRVTDWPENLAVGAVQFLLKHGADVNARRQDLSTPLHLSVAWGYFEVARMLLQCRVDVNSRDDEGETPLHLVRKSRSGINHLNIVRLLLERGADVNSQDEKGTAALHNASHTLDLEMARLLVDYGAVVNAVDTWGQTPLHRVFKTNYHSEARVSVAQLLVEHGADVNVRDNGHATPLHLASCNRDLESVRFLLDHGAVVNALDTWGQTPLHRVFMSNLHSEDPFSVAQLLLEHDANVDIRDNDHATPLHLASRNRDLKSVRALLDHGANVSVKNNQGQTPLHQVLLFKRDPKDRFGVAQLLVECGADVNAQDADDETPLHLASEYYFPELELVRMLLNNGADVHAKNSQGQTPFHRRFESKHFYREFFDVAQLLVEHGADVNARDREHQTLLHMASYRLDLKLMRVLLDRGANVSAEDSRGRTPLCRVLAVDKHHSDEDRFDAAQLLVERGADPNTPDSDHETLLHLASRRVSLEMVWILLKHGANPSAKNNEGKIPFEVVRESIREEMMRSPSEYSIRRAQRAEGVALMNLLYGY